jgi:IS5 family transposase
LGRRDRTPLPRDAPSPEPRRASFRRFCGFAAAEPTPERTAFVRFRAELVRRNLDRPLFEAITRQLEGTGVVTRTAIARLSGSVSEICSSPVRSRYASISLQRVRRSA